MPTEYEPDPQHPGFSEGVLAFFKNPPWAVRPRQPTCRNFNKVAVRPRQPTCRNCNEVAVRKIACLLNSNNAGRPYYICPSCPWDDRWVCWEDAKGMSACNPLCDCEEPSRLDIMGKSKGVKAGRGFWTCATGRCWYYSENEEGTPGVSPDGGFYP